MPLTPADVHNVAFGRPPIGKRGYSEDEVDQFLDLVEDTLQQLQDDNDDLQERNEELEAQLAQHDSVSSSLLSSAPTQDTVNEEELRQEIESKLRSEYDAELAQAVRAADQAKAEAAQAQIGRAHV